ncbi:MAG: hypothetical protein JXA87_09950 [Thermoleophilia bacterium]|nr:hypothetical protein [Thermoleophilia bacterium]
MSEEIPENVRESNPEGRDSKVPEVRTGAKGLMKSRFSTMAAILLCMLLGGMSLMFWACDEQLAAETGTGPYWPASEGTAAPTNGVTDRTAADIVLEYFATAAEVRVQGVAIDGIQVATQMGQRTLSLYLVSDGPDEANGSIAWLCFGATSEEGWTGDLNRDWGLGLVWVHIYTSYPGGDSEHSVADIANQSLTTYGGTPHWRGGLLRQHPPCLAPPPR